MRPPVFVSDGIFGTDEVCAVWSENLFQGRHVERLRRLNQAVGRLFRCIEFFLFYLRCRGRICFSRYR